MDEWMDKWMDGPTNEHWWNYRIYPVKLVGPKISKNITFAKLLRWNKSIESLKLIKLFLLTIFAKNPTFWGTSFLHFQIQQAQAISSHISSHFTNLCKFGSTCKQHLFFCDFHDISAIAVKYCMANISEARILYGAVLQWLSLMYNSFNKVQTQVLKTMLSNFCQSTIPQKHFIIKVACKAGFFSILFGPEVKQMSQKKNFVWIITIFKIIAVSLLISSKRFGQK